jgi:hypothetical protein
MRVLSGAAGLSRRLLLVARRFDLRRGHARGGDPHLVGEARGVLAGLIDAEIVAVAAAARLRGLSRARARGRGRALSHQELSTLSERSIAVSSGDGRRRRHAK